MAATTEMQGPAPSSDELNQVLEQFLAGRINLDLLLSTVTRALDEDMQSAYEVQERLDDALRAGELPEQVWERITAEIDHAISEDAPTEWSEESSDVPPQLLGLHDSSGEYSPLAADDGPEPALPPVLEDRVAVAPAAPEKSCGPMAPGTLLGNRYVIVSRVKTGGMGDIYKALDRRKKEAGAADPWVAIKVVGDEFAQHPQALATLEREASHSRQLAHPNVIRVFDFERDGNRCFITMEWLDGASLVDTLDRLGPQPLHANLARRVIRGLGAALVHAHARGIVHADIKPGNVFLCRNGEPKLLDFGVARAAAASGDDLQLAARTPAYCSAEVLEGLPPTEQDDLYSFALVAYRLLTGRRAFGRATALEAEAGGQVPDRIAGIDDREWLAMLKALAFRRADRTAQVAEFLADFDRQDSDPAASQLVPAEPAEEAAVPGQDLPAEDWQAAPAETEASALPPGTRSRRPLAIAASLLGLAAASAAWFLAGDPEPPPAAARLPASPPASPDEALPEPAPTGLAPLVAHRPMAVQSGDLAAARTASPELPADPFPAPAPTSRAKRAEALATRGRRADPPPAPDVTRNTRKAARVAGNAPAAGSGDRPAGPGEAASDSASPQPAGAPTIDNTPTATQAGMPELPESAGEEPPVKRAAATSANADGAVADTATEPAKEPGAAEPALAEQSTARAGEIGQAAPGAMGPPPPLPAGDTPADYGPSPGASPVAPAPGEYGPKLVGPARVELSDLDFERFVEPKFPRRASARNTRGWVQVEFLLTKDGKTDRVRVLESDPPSYFDEVAIEAIEKWQFEPYMVDGRATEVLTGVRLRFEPEP